VISLSVLIAVITVNQNYGFCTSDLSYCAYFASYCAYFNGEISHVILFPQSPTHRFDLYHHNLNDRIIIENKVKQVSICSKI